jgi:hypothetical protein
MKEPERKMLWFSINIMTWTGIHITDIMTCINLINTLWTIHDSKVIRHGYLKMGNLHKHISHRLVPNIGPFMLFVRVLLSHQSAWTASKIQQQQHAKTKTASESLRAAQRSPLHVLSVPIRRDQARCTVCSVSCKSVNSWKCGCNRLCSTWLSILFMFGKTVRVLTGVITLLPKDWGSNLKVSECM